ncbi:guanylyl cyclase domain-containing protein 1 [Dinochytrium kinnereticum]|nr:guanylyl cyclase domain-containing protein 1 [Dinochytrium kinnereticum]
MVLAGAFHSGLAPDDPSKTNPLSLRTILAASGSCESVWTIDLAYIMRHFGLDDFTFYTSYIGVNLQYASKHHFDRDSIGNDRRRIHSLFADAQDFGVRIVPMVLSMEDMRRFLLSEQYAILILVNLSRLKCRICPKSHTSHHRHNRQTSGNSAMTCTTGKAGRRDSFSLASSSLSSTIAGTADDYRTYYSKYLLPPHPIQPLIPPSQQRTSAIAQPKSRHSTSSRKTCNIGCMNEAFRNPFRWCLPKHASTSHSTSDDESFGDLEAGGSGDPNAPAPQMDHSPSYGTTRGDGAPMGVGRVRRHVAADGIHETTPLLEDLDGKIVEPNVQATVTDGGEGSEGGLLGSLFSWLGAGKELNSASTVFSSTNPSKVSIPDSALPVPSNVSPFSAASTRLPQESPPTPLGLPGILESVSSPSQSPLERRGSKASDASDGRGSATPGPLVGTSPSKQRLLTPILGGIFTQSSTVAAEEAKCEPIEVDAGEVNAAGTPVGVKQASGFWHPFSWMYTSSSCANSHNATVSKDTGVMRSSPMDTTVHPYHRDSAANSTSSSPRRTAPTSRRSSRSPQKPNTNSPWHMTHRGPSSTHLATQAPGPTRAASGTISRGRRGSAALEQEEFIGHYVLLVGYDAASDGFLFRDPGVEEGMCFVDAGVLDAARGSPGTDHDAIVVRVR